VRFRYSQWDGTQDPLGPDLSAADLLDAMNEEILAGGGAERALNRLLRRGMRGRFGGLDALRARLRAAKRRQEEALDLTGPLEEVRERLREVLDLERAELAKRNDEDARFRELRLAQLPEDAPGAIGELKDYDFASPEAAEKFQELMAMLQEQVLGAYFRQLGQNLQNLSPEELQRMKDMLAELNQMIDANERGEHTHADFDGFMSRFGDMFPEQPKNLQELLEDMARRMAAMSRLLASLPAEQRRELEELARQVMEDMDLQFQVDRLANALQGQFPGMPWDDPAMAGGEEAMPLQATVDALERLHDFEDLERSMRGDYAGAGMDDIDEDAVRRALGEDALRDLRRLKEIERTLERAGLLTREGGQLRVTARGARKLGERALVRLFEALKRDREGSHASRDTGGMAEPTGATRPWAFGDTGRIAVQKTVFNAVTRSGPSASPRIHAEDFELEEAETRTATATALLLDLSFSMPLRGHWVHAKKMALALHALIEGRYPHDTLYLIGFSDYARRMQPEDLTAAGWERVYGTNMQHAFHLAGRLLAEHPRAARQVIMVTDGEPTAHLEGEEVFFSWPPVPETVQRTLTEAVRLSKSGITLNVFMLEEEPRLQRFMERLARLTNGRIFQTQSEGLGEFVVRDYVRRRRAS
jgi:uncharacterized protein with von Willebrand factor type A (vWA) domain